MLFHMREVGKAQTFKKIFKQACTFSLGSAAREIARETSNKKVSPDVARDAQLDAAAARPKNARARREPDSPMPQACPEDAPVISSSK